MQFMIWNSDKTRTIRFPPPAMLVLLFLFKDMWSEGHDAVGAAMLFGWQEILCSCIDSIGKSDSLLFKRNFSGFTKQKKLIRYVKCIEIKL